MIFRTVLGRTNLEVNKDGFGALPVQRASLKEACSILERALDNGINFFDTARVYSDSEEKIGASISKKRDKFFLATKTGAQNVQTFWEHLETSLKNLKTDYIDIYQFHNPKFVPKPGDESGLYDAARRIRVCPSMNTGKKCAAFGQVRFVKKHLRKARWRTSARRIYLSISAIRWKSRSA